uniref:Calcineurin-like phosphoesterase domain-containing protein n=1 Tax=Ditylum brightwellii TaxID=49249 RepID=A0A7S4R3B6_9STRA
MNWVFTLIISWWGRINSVLFGLFLSKGEFFSGGGDRWRWLLQGGEVLISPPPNIENCVLRAAYLMFLEMCISLLFAYFLLHSHILLYFLLLFRWYDGSLTIPDTNDLCSNFNKWPWVDFFRCVWPEEHQPQIEHNGRIPVGLNERMLEWNTCAIDNLRADYRNRMFPKPDANEDNEAPSSPLRSLITFSHFLPNQQCLPDWKDVNCETFLKDEWFDHGAADTSAKFAKVAGSKNMDEQIRSIIPSSSSSSTLSEKNDVRHIHVFGHSHRPKDFTYKGVRYIHNPLGYSRERDMHMVSQDVNFQLIWDTTRAEGEVAGESVIRYWEEQGGGVEALQKRMILRRKKRGAVVRQLVEDTRKKVKK